MWPEVKLPRTHICVWAWWLLACSFSLRRQGSEDQAVLLRSGFDWGTVLQWIKWEDDQRWFPALTSGLHELVSTHMQKHAHEDEEGEICKNCVMSMEAGTDQWEKPSVKCFCSGPSHVILHAAVVQNTIEEQPWSVPSTIHHLSGESSRNLLDELFVG